MTSFYGEFRGKDIISDEAENRVSRANVDKWIFRILLVLIGFMPLIVLGHVEEVVSPLISDNSLLTSGNKGDLFTHYKALMTLVITVITGLLLLSKIVFMDGRIRKTKLNYILGVFVVVIVVSTIFSPNITIALNGQYNRSDGAVMWLCYITLMFIAMNINYPKKVVCYVLYSLIPFVLINLYIITMNFTGQDLMQKEWVQSIVSVFLPEGISMTEGSQIVGTLNQWNYMSGMFGMMTVMFLSWAITEKSWINSIVGIIVATVSIAVMFMSVSTSGFITLVLTIPLLLFLIFKVENRKKALISLTLFLVVSASVFHVLAKDDRRIWDESFGFVFNSNPYFLEESTSFHLSNRVYASDKAFVLPVLPERGWSAGTGRTYIWEKTINLTKDRLFVGYGLDSLMYNFPHYNIDARGELMYETTIVDKPHNTYIGLLYGTGIVGFIAVIALLVYFGYTMLSSLFKKINLQYVVFGIASTAYFIQALFNDSLAGISAISFVFTGIMFALLLKENKLEGN